MKLKSSLSLLALAVCATVSTSAFAQSSGTLNIKGNISPVSCTPTVVGGSVSGTGGSGIYTVTLPDAQITDLNTTGATFGDTEFEFDLVGCTVATAGTPPVPMVDNFWTHFHGGNINLDGRIKSTSGSTNVSFQLLDGPAGSTAVITAGGAAAAGGPTATQGTGAAFTGTNPNMAANKKYTLRYYAETGITAADVGPVSSTVEYQIYYY